MFQKLRGIFGAGKGDGQSNPSSPAGNITAIVVSQEALAKIETEPQALVQSVVEYVNAMLQQGRFRQDELPAEAMQAYQCDYYLAQVNNGGHSQYIANSRPYPMNYELTAQGLPAMKADAYFEVFQEMRSWMAANPAEADVQTGFSGGRAEPLDVLDKRFYALDQTQRFSGFSARWIANLKHLRAVPENDLPRVYSEMAALNPHLKARQMAARVNQIRHYLSDPLHLGLGYAGNMAEVLRPVFSINGGSYREIDGKEVLAFGVDAVGQKYFGFMTEEGATLHERIEHDNPNAPDRNDPDSMKAALESGFFKNYKPPEAGARMAHIGITEIEDAAKQSERLAAPAAVDLLLRTFDEDPGLTFVSFARRIQRDGRDVCAYVVLTDSEVLKAHVEEPGALLFRGDEIIAKMARADINKYIDFLAS